MEDQLYRSPPHRAAPYFTGVLMPMSSSHGYVACGGGSGVSGKYRPGSPTACVLLPGHYLELPGMSYKAVCRCLLLVLGWEVPRSGQTANQGQLLRVLGLEALGKRDGACPAQMLLV